jgi:predicted secreted hydrolase
VGWDWFSLQLDDGRELMYYQLRNKDGSASRFSEGTLVAPDGAPRKIDREAVSLQVHDTWTSPDGTHTYPVEWTLRVPSEDLALRVVPLFPHQELDVSVRYWEGAVRVKDAAGNVVGQGYVELTGYGDSPATPAS